MSTLRILRHTSLIRGFTVAVVVRTPQKFSLSQAQRGCGMRALQSPQAEMQAVCTSIGQPGILNSNRLFSNGLPQREIILFGIPLEAIAPEHR